MSTRGLSSTKGREAEATGCWVLGDALPGLALDVNMRFPLLPCRLLCVTLDFTGGNWHTCASQIFPVSREDGVDSEWHRQPFTFPSTQCRRSCHVHYLAKSVSTAMILSCLIRNRHAVSVDNRPSMRFILRGIVSLALSGARGGACRGDHRCKGSQTQSVVASRARFTVIMLSVRLFALKRVALDEEGVIAAGLMVVAL